MVIRWTYLVLLVVAMASLAVLSVAVGTQLADAAATSSPDAQDLVGAAIMVLSGVGLVAAGMRLRRRGRTGLAATLVGVVAAPAALGVAGFLLIVAMSPARPG